MQKLTFVQFLIIKLLDKENGNKNFTTSIEVPRKLYIIYASSKHQNDIGDDAKSVVKSFGEIQANKIYEKLNEEGLKVTRMTPSQGFIKVFIEGDIKQELMLDINLNGFSTVELSSFGDRELLVEFSRSFIYKFIQLTECRFD